MTQKKEYPAILPMHNPPHPGAVLKDVVIDALGITITDAAAHLDVDRVTLSRLINGKAALSVEMALRLSKALNTTPDVWLGMQQAYDLWHATQRATLDLSHIHSFESARHSTASSH